MSDSETENTAKDLIAEEATVKKKMKRRLALSSLRNPTWEELHSNYTKNELQKYCSQLNLGGIWTTKEKLVDKLIAHYNSLPSSSRPSTFDTSQNGGNEDSSMAELYERFERFIRETNDNFYVVNNNLAEKEKEINDLKTKLFLAEEKIESLEEALRIRNGEQENDATSSERKTLLIGDSCLQEVRQSDLQDNVIVRTLPETNMTLLKSWITEKLNYSLQECIIYCGTQDLLDEETTLEEILDALGTIVADLKRKYEDVSVKVCELVPSLKSEELIEKTDLYNNKLSNWCNDNGVVFIKTDKHFKLGTGDVDLNCYGSHENFNYDTLSRIGATRLLDAISSVCQSNFLCGNWRDIKQKSVGTNNSKIKSSTLNEVRSSKYVPDFNKRVRRRPNYQSESHQFTSKLSNNRGPVSLRGNWSSHNYSRVNRSQVDSNVYYSQRNNNVMNGSRGGCFNCGEFNHRQSNCRYDHKVKCNTCQEYGHKSRLCRYNYH